MFLQLCLTPAREFWKLPGSAVVFVVFFRSFQGASLELRGGEAGPAFTHHNEKALTSGLAVACGWGVATRWLECAARLLSTGTNALPADDPAVPPEDAGYLGDFWDGGIASQRRRNGEMGRRNRQRVKTVISGSRLSREFHSQGLKEAGEGV